MPNDTSESYCEAYKTGHQLHGALDDTESYCEAAAYENYEGASRTEHDGTRVEARSSTRTMPPREAQVEPQVQA